MNAKPERLQSLDALRGFDMAMIIGLGELLRALASSCGATSLALQFEHVSWEGFRIEDLIFDLKERVTIAIVTHNMQQASRVSDYTAFMYLGELVEFGPTSRIFENPREPLTQEYITGRFG